MLGIMRGWWSDFCERNNITHWDNGIKWRREGKDVSVREMGVEYHFGRNARRLMLLLDIDNNAESLYNFKIGIPFLFNFYFGADAKPNRFTLWFSGNDWSLGGRETGFSFDKEYIRLSLHKTTDGWSSDKFCGWGSVWTWGDIFLGDHNSKMTGVTFDTHTAGVGPSKNHPHGQQNVVFDVKYEHNVSTYSRWYMFWYRRNYVRISLTPRAKIIVPGKGDNGWDQDDETMGTISFGWDTKTVEAAVYAYNQSIHRYMTR